MHRRFTDQAYRVVVLAQQEAKVRGHERVGTEHLLLGLIDAGGVAASALESAGLNPEAIRQQARQISGHGQQARKGGHAPLTVRAGNVLELSLRAALRLGDNHIGTEHILLALMDEPGASGAEVLVRLGADPRRIRRQITMLTARSRLAQQPHAEAADRPARSS
jgi:ATP-dependent Clp protease ATP-binding subunit ClpC